MNLNQLDYFVTAAETLNFTKTARKFFISQTAITQQIKALEENIGVTLFDRSNRTLALTPAGQVFYKECKEILIRTADALDKVRKAEGGIIGSLKIGFISGYEKTNLTERIKNFHIGYPNVSLTFVRKDSRELRDLLQKGELDLIFDTAREDALNAGYGILPISRYPVRAVLYPSHPLAGHTSVRLAELYNERLIMLSLDEANANRPDPAYPHIVQYSNDVDVILLMVSAGLGISLIPQFALNYYNQAQSLSIIPLEPRDALEITVYAIWNQENKNASIANFLQHLELR
ncbi:LysR family transcriptional regulator [Paenibacillus sp. NFR01]|uniref:LysR family transcriptional regulator n=1 Tax=Paenibacillus sp. NFR01 TaxID=1566279 RepID=UPI0008C4CF7E|nr:LysR family transcriptional regulator [Paenibacillus sp. NFR01]SEU27886.1 DNA-binding transcriptional regulator, LysR family [Paenibacillus sp. NFR01]